MGEMKEENLVKIVINEKKCKVLINLHQDYVKKIYEIPIGYFDDVKIRINKEIEEYIKETKRLQKTINSEIATIPTILDEQNPYLIDLKRKIEKILKEYSKGVYKSLENYMNLE